MPYDSKQLAYLAGVSVGLEKAANSGGINQKLLGAVLGGAGGLGAGYGAAKLLGIDPATTTVGGGALGTGLGYAYGDVGLDILNHFIRKGISKIPEGASTTHVDTTPEPEKAAPASQGNTGGAVGTATEAPSEAENQSSWWPWDSWKPWPLAGGGAAALYKWLKKTRADDIAPWIRKAT